MCTKPRPHAELIKAWADGAVIQYLDDSGNWEDVFGNSPTWGSANKYRIKPEPADIEKYGVEVGDVWRTSGGQTLTVLDNCGGRVISLVTRTRVSVMELKTLLFRRGVVNKLGE